MKFQMWIGASRSKAARVPSATAAHTTTRVRMGRPLWTGFRRMGTLMQPLQLGGGSTPSPPGPRLPGQHRIDRVDQPVPALVRVQDDAVFVQDEDVRPSPDLPGRCDRAWSGPIPPRSILKSLPLLGTLYGLELVVVVDSQQHHSLVLVALQHLRDLVEVAEDEIGLLSCKQAHLEVRGESSQIVACVALGVCGCCGQGQPGNPASGAIAPPLCPRTVLCRWRF